ncbi:hypothetical protein [Novosphingobium sp. CCH12-A3]|uniref:hypothetical protein n=1 Tax=Novosphingobium sp. CCH12-A3 TaxID=1768752 RepID=UPI0012E3A2C7|nr:hypothetical protein [Novosphingobium sp. CCH12-A3]
MIGICSILESPQLTTENARNDLAISVEQIAFSDTDPYHEQTQSASNATVRNAVAAALSAAASAISNPKVVGAAAAGGLVTGAASVIGKAAMTAVLATNFDPVMLFISGNVEILRHYIMVAFPSFDHLPILLDKARELWKKMSGIL